MKIPACTFCLTLKVGVMTMLDTRCLLEYGRAFQGSHGGGEWHTVLLSIYFVIAGGGLNVMTTTDLVLSLSSKGLLQTIAEPGGRNANGDP